METISDYDGNGVAKNVYTDAEVSELVKIRDNVPAITSDTVMQKVIPEEDLKYYMEDQYIDSQKGMIGGFISKAADTAPFSKTTEEAYENLRLDYNGTKFNAPERDLYTIRFKIVDNKISNVQIPYSNQFREKANLPLSDEKSIFQPWTGNGFVGGKIAIPEYNIPKTERIIPKEMVMYKNNKPFAYYSETKKRFIKLGG